MTQRTLRREREANHPPFLSPYLFSNMVTLVINRVTFALLLIHVKILDVCDGGLTLVSFESSALSSGLCLLLI